MLKRATLAFATKSPKEIQTVSLLPRIAIHFVFLSIEMATIETQIYK